MNYKKVFESWELEDRAAQPKEFGNRRKSDKRFYKRMASKAVRRYVKVDILNLEDDDYYDDLMDLKALLTAQKDILLTKIEEIDEVLDSLPI